MNNPRETIKVMRHSIKPPTLTPLESELLNSLQLAFDLLDHSEVRHFISTVLGEQAQLQRALNATRTVIYKVAKGTV